MEGIRKGWALSLSRWRAQRARGKDQSGLVLIPVLSSRKYLRDKGLRARSRQVRPWGSVASEDKGHLRCVY